MLHYFEYSADFFFLGESHDFWEMVYVDSGAVEIYSDGVKHIVEKGSIIFHEPNEFHTLKSYNNTSPSLIIVSFICRDEALNFLKKKLFRLKPDEKNLLTHMVFETQLAFSTPINIPSEHIELSRRKVVPFAGEQLLGLYLEQFLITLIRRHTVNVQPPDIGLALEFMVPQSENPYVNEVLQYLSANLYRRLTLLEICKGNRIGRSRLQELFHLEFSCGVIEYFNKMKAAAAKSLLRANRQSVSEISEMLSYSSTAYFSKHFKKVFGMSPTQYRQTIIDFSEKLSEFSPEEQVMVHNFGYGEASPL